MAVGPPTVKLHMRRKLAAFKEMQGRRGGYHRDLVSSIQQLLCQLWHLDGCHTAADTKQDSHAGCGLALQSWIPLACLLQQDCSPVCRGQSDLVGHSGCPFSLLPEALPIVLSFGFV